MYTGNLKYLFYPGIIITIVSSKRFFVEWNVWEQYLKKLTVKEMLPSISPYSPLKTHQCSIWTIAQGYYANACVPPGKNPFSI